MKTVFKHYDTANYKPINSFRGINMFFSGIQKEINRAFFDQLPMRDQKEFLQQLYDNGYNVPEIAKHLSMNPQTIYSRINAHRGRGSQPKTVN